MMASQVIYDTCTQEVVEMLDLVEHAERGLRECRAALQRGKRGGARNFMRVSRFASWAARDAEKVVRVPVPTRRA